MRAGGFTIAPASGHPQFAMHALLGRFGISRGAVTALAPDLPRDREVLTSEAMRPSDSTALWRERLNAAGVSKRITRGMQGLAVIEAAERGNGSAGDCGCDARGPAQRTSRPRW